MGKGGGSREDGFGRNGSTPQKKSKLVVYHSGRNDSFSQWFERSCNKKSVEPFMDAEA